MLQNACFLAKIGADTAENEQHVTEILPKTGNYPTGPPGNAAPGAGGAAASGKRAMLAGLDADGCAVFSTGLRIRWKCIF